MARQRAAILIPRAALVEMLHIQPTLLLLEAVAVLGRQEAQVAQEVVLLEALRLLAVAGVLLLLAALQPLARRVAQVRDLQEHRQRQAITL